MYRTTRPSREGVTLCSLGRVSTINSQRILKVLLNRRYYSYFSHKVPPPNGQKQISVVRKPKIQEKT